MHSALISLQCLTSTWVVLLHIGDFTAPITPPPPPSIAVATRCGDTYLKLKMCMRAIVTMPVYVTCDPAHLLKTASGGTAENRINVFLNDET